MEDKKGNNFAFIDGQNLNLGIQSLGWKLNLARFRKYLADSILLKKEAKERIVFMNNLRKKLEYK